MMYMMYLILLRNLIFKRYLIFFVKFFRVCFNCLELLEFVGICGIRASPSLPVMERAAASSPTHLLPLSFNHRRQHHHHLNHYTGIMLIIIGVFRVIYYMQEGSPAMHWILVVDRTILFCILTIIIMITTIISILVIII